MLLFYSSTLSCDTIFNLPQKWHKIIKHFRFQRDFVSIIIDILFLVDERYVELTYWLAVIFNQ